MKRAYVFDLTYVDSPALADFVGDTVDDDNGDQWVYVENTGAATLAVGNCVAQEAAEAEFGSGQNSPSSSPFRTPSGSCSTPQFPSQTVVG